MNATDRELAMARQLIEAQATEFDPGKYRDEYRERVLDLIERKAAGEDIAVQPMVEEREEVPDLMAALEQSLAAAQQRPPAQGPAKSRTERRPAKKPSRKSTKKKPAAKKKPRASRARPRPPKPTRALPSAPARCGPRTRSSRC